MDAHAWDDRYTAEPMLWGAQPNATVRAEVEELPPGRAVDLACGDGRHAAWLSTLGWQVDAVDFSTVAIEQASARPGAEHDLIRWTVGDVETWIPDEPVDLVLVAYLHLPALVDLLRRATGWLRPDGRLAYVGHARENIAHGVGGPQDPSVLPTVSQLAAAADGTYVHRLGHLDRVIEAGTAVDVCLVASPFDH